MYARSLRKSLRLTQAQFWNNIGLTQSAGSRYENERATPEPVRILVKLVYECNDARAVSYLTNLRGIARGNS